MDYPARLAPSGLPMASNRGERKRKTQDGSRNQQHEQRRREVTTLAGLPADVRGAQTTAGACHQFGPSGTVSSPGASPGRPILRSPDNAGLPHSEQQDKDVSGYPTVDESFDRLHRPGWSVGEV